MITGPLVRMLARNAAFAEHYQAPPAFMDALSSDNAKENGVVVISCSDPRVNPEQILGLDPTLVSIVIRNAGGRVLDVLRTVAVMQTIGASGTIVVIHHTDCGMTHLTDAQIKESLTEVAPEDKATIESMHFGEILDVDQSIVEDLAILRASPLIKKTTQIVGLRYDIKTGLLTPVE